MLVPLLQSDIEQLLPVSDTGLMTVDRPKLSRLISRALGLAGLRTAVSAIDYCEDSQGRPIQGTASISGVWWLPHGDDTALVGSFVLDALALSVSEEGERDAPLVEASGLVQAVATAVLSEYSSSGPRSDGLFRVSVPEGEKLVRVVATRDYRIRRAEDILSSEEMVLFDRGAMGLVVVQLVGDGKALVIKDGV